MIRFVLPLILILGFQVSAQETTNANIIKTETPAYSIAPKTMATEFGIMSSSINSGTRFANVGIMRQWQNGFELGVRGLMPVDFERETQTYMGQLFMRFDFVNAVNVMFLETSLFQGFFSDFGTTAFAGFGATYGYRRELMNDFTAGVNIGVDWSTSRISRDNISDVSALYSRLGVVGGYNF